MAAAKLFYEDIHIGYYDTTLQGFLQDVGTGALFLIYKIEGKYVYLKDLMSDVDVLLMDSPDIYDPQMELMSS